MYATEVCLIRSHNEQSLEFAVTCSFIKIFDTGSHLIVAQCQQNFYFVCIKHQNTIC